MQNVFTILNSAFVLVILLTITQCGTNAEMETNRLAYGENTKSEVRAPAYIYPDTSFHFNSSVSVIFQDSRGNIWIGSENNGVTLKRGQHYTNFVQLDGASLSAKDYLVIDIQEDDNNDIWIQTTASLNKFNGAEITRFPLNNGANLKELDPKPIYETLETLDVLPTDIWFQAGNDGTIMRIRKGKLSLFTIPKAANESDFKYNPNWVFSTMKDDANNLWFGTIASGLIHFKNNEFTQLNPPELEGTVLSILEDSQHNVWFGTTKGSLYLYKNGVLINFGKAQNFNMINADYTPTAIWDIEEDANGNIWFATMFKGAFMYDGKEIKTYNMDNGLPSNTLQSITKTKDGTLWIGTLRGGLIKYDGSIFRLINSNKLDDC